MFWLVRRALWSAPRRLLLAAVAVAFPVATLASTVLFVDDSVGTMTATALAPVQVEMRGLATSLDVDMSEAGRQLQTIAGVRRVDRFGSANVVVAAPGGQGRVTARLFAVDPSYFDGRGWLRPSGDLRNGALLNPALSQALGFQGGGTVSIDLRGDTPPLGLSVPVAGRVDLREATTWFAIPAGDVQGDVAVVPRSIVVDYETFDRVVLPTLRRVAGNGTAVTNPGLSELPPVSVEAHLAVDHGTYPSAPAHAVAWSATLRRVVERRVPGALIVADNAAEPLTEARADATNAKVLFMMLGLPSVLVAAGLGLAAASALAEAHRREDALLRLRGASDAQLVRLAMGEGAVATVVGSVLGLAGAVFAVGAVIGHPVWRDVPTDQLVLAGVLAVTAGLITTAARLVPLVRAGRRSGLVTERRRLTGKWTPAWRRARLDVVAVAVGMAILIGNLLSGGLKPTPIEGQALALSFYVLLAPLALWMGATLLVVRGLLALLVRWSSPDRSRPLSSWPATAMRWLGRRPARAAVALVLGAMAVGFGTEVTTFVTTYHSAKQADARAAFGADVRLVPSSDRVRPQPSLGPEITALTPIRTVPSRVGSDRKTIMAIDPGSYRDTSIASPQIVAGKGLDVLVGTKAGVLIAQEMASSFAMAPGDTMPVTVFPDDLDLSQKLNLHVVGVYRAFPPTEPISEMVMTTASLPAPVPAPDLYLGRVAPGNDPSRVAAGLRRAGAAGEFSVTTITDRVGRQQRTLTALNLDGLSRIEIAGAGLIAALGVGVLGAFLVLERRRELALLRMMGAGTRQVLTGSLLECSLAVLGSLMIGLPLGLGLGMLSVRVLGLFFTLPPPAVTLPIASMVALTMVVLLTSAVAVGVALARVARVEVASILREP